MSLQGKALTALKNQLGGSDLETLCNQYPQWLMYCGAGCIALHNDFENMPDDLKAQLIGVPVALTTAMDMRDL